MRNYPLGSVEDRRMLTDMPIEELLDFIFLQIRNLWRVDGLYFLGIEEKFGTEAATTIDAGVWQILANIEAKSLRKMYGLKEDIDIRTITNLLKKSSWGLDQPFKTIQISDHRAVLRIDRCRTQETRVKKGFGEFPCKNVRHGYLKNFAETLNPKAKVKCLTCPPDHHPPDLWCEWEFTLRR